MEITPSTQRPRNWKRQKTVPVQCATLDVARGVHLYRFVDACAAAAAATAAAADGAVHDGRTGGGGSHRSRSSVRSASGPRRWMD